MTTVFFSRLHWNNSLFLFGCNKAIIFLVSRKIFAIIDHMQEHIFPDFSLTILKLLDFSRFSRRVATLCEAMRVNNWPKVATQWHSGATRESNPGPRVRIPSALTTKPLSRRAIIKHESHVQCSRDHVKAFSHKHRLSQTPVGSSLHLGQ